MPIGQTFNNISRQFIRRFRWDAGECQIEAGTNNSNGPALVTNGHNHGVLKRIFNHGLDTVLPEDDDPLDGATIVADGIEDVLKNTL